jgi:hypothetical protein
MPALLERALGQSANIRVTRRRSALRLRPSFEAAILQEDEKQPTTYDLRLTGGRSISASFREVVQKIVEK